jgi:endoglucanase
MVSVHFYDPYDFTLNESNDTIYAWGQTAIDAGSAHAVTWHAESGVLTSMGYIEDAFTDNGIPVIFGEYGAVDKSFVDSSNSEYRRYYYEYVTKQSRRPEVSPSAGQRLDRNYGLALFNRNTNAVVQQDIIDGIMRGAAARAT